jgi:hypothetical protein
MSGTLSQDMKPFLATPEPPDLGPGPRPGVEPEGALNKRLSEAFGSSKVPSQRQELIRALILLWHDHFESAHKIAQDIETSDGSFVHAILHRREPDYWNAKYWFRRVGKHPAFGEIANRVGGLLDSKPAEALRAKLLDRGSWDAVAFVDLCDQANRNGEHKLLLREIQAIETSSLLEFFSEP